MASEGVDRAAEQALNNLRRNRLNARNISKQEPYEKTPGDLGGENWRAMSARKGLEDVARLRGFGADWLTRQPGEVQHEVDDAAHELQELRGVAIMDGAHHLPVDLPDDPSLH